MKTPKKDLIEEINLLKEALNTLWEIYRKDLFRYTCKVPRVLENDLISIERDGEDCLLSFTSEVEERIKEGVYTKEMFRDTVTLTPEKFDKLIK